jgi:hypothetical protein
LGFATLSANLQEQALTEVKDSSPIKSSNAVLQ